LEAHTIFISRTIPEVEGSMFLSNIGTHLPDHTAFYLLVVYLTMLSVIQIVISNDTHTEHQNTRIQDDVT